MPDESYCRRLTFLLLGLCDVFRALVNSLVCSFCTDALELVLFQCPNVDLVKNWNVLHILSTLSRLENGDMIIQTPLVQLVMMYI